SPDGTAENVRNAIVQRLGGLRHAVHTLTADNGKEFADHRLIAACLQSDFYFADPYCPWQRGSNENANGLTRQYLPRQADVSTITDAHLRWIEQRLYNFDLDAKIGMTEPITPPSAPAPCPWSHKRT
ncbi:IS30 family transposase, partial [Xanthomonas oryzae pv. oryzae]